MYKLYPPTQLLNDTGNGFRWIRWAHNIYIIFFQVDIANRSIGSKKMIHHLQGGEFSETCQLVLDRGQEDGFHGGDGFFLGWSVNDSVPSEHHLVLTEPLYPECLYLCGD